MITQPLGPEVNICRDFCHACAFISHACSPFHGCLSQQAMQRFANRFHQQETSYAHAEMIWHRWFDSLTLDISVWQAFTLLLVVLATQHSRSESNAPEKSNTCHQRFLAHFPGHNVFVLLGWKTPTYSLHSTRFRCSSREFKAQHNRVRSN